jgi:hypothetical protein
LNDGAADKRQSDHVIAILGSAGLLEIALPNGNAAATLGAGVGTLVTITTRGLPER